MRAKTPYSKGACAVLFFRPHGGLQYKKRPGQLPDRAFFLFGAGERVRTVDLYLGKVPLYQLSYTREGCVL